MSGLIAYMRFQSPRSGKFVSNVCRERLRYSTTSFQSPRSGKFVSNIAEVANQYLRKGSKFQSPRSGKFVSNLYVSKLIFKTAQTFQSPRSGKFVSNILKVQLQL